MPATWPTWQIDCCAAVMWHRNGLSIVLAVLFAGTLVGHSVAGWLTTNGQLEQHGREPLTYGEFLRSAEFMETVAENWESEFLQMAVYVVFTVWLRQRGSAESKKFEPEEVDEDPLLHQHDPSAPWPVRRGGLALAVYRHSLSLALLTLFAVSFVGHAAGGARLQNQENAQHGSAERVGTLEFMATSQFWYESLQNWQSEFLAVLSIVTLSIFLRQHGSPESKPVHAAHSDTGKT
jgi:hypothetical protein